MNSKKLPKMFAFVVICSVFSFIAFVTACSAVEGSKDKKDPAKHSVPQHDHDAMMEKWKEFATPNENHKVLGALVGNWDYTIKWWMSPDGEPEVSKGTSEIEWIMGGRYIQQEVEGTSMGQPFEGIGMTGYDNEKKQYQSVWIDNMGTGIMTASGDYDSKTKTIADKGTFSCPAEGQKPFRALTKFVSPDSFTYEWYMPGPDGKEFRAMEIVYTRKK